MMVVNMGGAIKVIFHIGPENSRRALLDGCIGVTVIT